MRRLGPTTDAGTHALSVALRLSEHWSLVRVATPALAGSELFCELAEIAASVISSVNQNLSFSVGLPEGQTYRAR